MSGHTALCEHPRPAARWSIHPPALKTMRRAGPALPTPALVRVLACGHAHRTAAGASGARRTPPPLAVADCNQIQTHTLWASSALASFSSMAGLEGLFFGESCSRRFCTGVLATGAGDLMSMSKATGAMVVIVACLLATGCEGRG